MKFDTDQGPHDVKTPTLPTSKMAARLLTSDVEGVEQAMRLADYLSRYTFDGA